MKSIQLPLHTPMVLSPHSVELNVYVPVLSEHSPIFNSRHDSSSIQIKTRVDLRETKQFDRSVEGQASKV